VVVTLSHAGYAKAQPLSEYQAQRRGGKGKRGQHQGRGLHRHGCFVANTHDTVLCFSSHGKVYWLKVYELPQAGGRPRAADGQPAAAGARRAHHATCRCRSTRGEPLRLHGHQQGLR
jgi:DNA gyrase subunit A